MSRAIVEDVLFDGAAVLRAVGDRLSDDVAAAGDMLAATLAGGGKVLTCGNGGSAAGAQHLVAELVGRFECERAALPAIALTTDTSVLTALGNDFGFERVFERQVRALGRPGDVLVALTTSGRSPNVVAAARAARDLGLRTIALTGAEGGPAAEACELSLRVPSTRTARVQEGHVAIAHALCAVVEAALADG